LVSLNKFISITTLQTYMSQRFEFLVQIKKNSNGLNTQKFLRNVI